MNSGITVMFSVLNISSMITGCPGSETEKYTQTVVLPSPCVTTGMGSVLFFVSAQPLPMKSLGP